MTGLKLKVVPQFPAQVVGGPGIAVTKTNGTFSIDLAYGEFPPLALIPPPEVPSLYTLLYNIVTGQYELVPISQIGGGGGGIPEAPINTFSYGRNAGNWVQVLPLSGGTLGGPLILFADPTVALGAATKQYVDSHTFTDAPIGGVTYGRRNAGWSSVLDLSGGTMTGVLTLAADPTTALQAATKQYADVHPFADAASDGFFYARFNGSWAKVLGLAGGTMSGPLALAGDPTLAIQAATKNYVDNAVASGGGGGGIPDAPSDGSAYGRRNAAWVQVLQLSGGTLTGALLLQGDPTTALGAATKQYVDSHGGLVDAPNDGSAYGRLSGAWQKVVPLAGGTLTGPLILAADPSATLGAATKQYVDAHTFVDAPNDGSTYGRKNLGWSKALDLAGGTLTGPLILAADPSNVLGAATKQYVDARTFVDAPNDGSTYGRKSLGWSKAVNLAGDTMTGALILNADPSALLGAATKQYVDNGRGTATPSQVGTAAVGTGTKWAREDHVHPATAPTPAQTDASTNIATTAFVGSAWTAYTPTVSSGAGAFTTVSANGRYKQVGKMVHFTITVVITTVGTASGILIASVPLPILGSAYVFAGRETATSGKMVQGIVQSTTSIGMVFYDTTSGLASGQQYIVCGAYETS